MKRKSLDVPLTGAQLRRRRKETALEIYSPPTLRGCGVRLIGGQVVVSVRANGNEHDVKFSGVARCGSVHSCPHCAAAITEARCQELIAGCGVWMKAGNTTAILTLTHSHRGHMPLVDQLAKVNEAIAIMKGSTSYKQARKDLGIVGCVHAKEITVGAINGWHPHSHQLEFITGAPATAELETYRRTVLACWQDACVSVGLGRPSDERGADLVIGSTVNEKIWAYCAKFGGEPGRPPPPSWGAEHEICKNTLKTGKNGDKSGERFHPFALLDRYDQTGKVQYRKWFLEYCTAIKGHKQLIWSRGLRPLLASMGMALDDRSNSEIAGHAAQYQEVCTISRADWSLLSRYNLVNRLWESLEACPSRACVIGYIKRAHELNYERLERDTSHCFDEDFQAASALLCLTTA